MMKLRILAVALCAALVAPVSAQAAEPTYPNRQINIVVPSTPGGVVDFTARLFQPTLTETLGQSVVIDNRPGGGGHLAGALVAKAPADGYTVFCSAGSILVSGVYPNLPYEPMVDMVPVARITAGGFLLLVPHNSPFKTLDDLVSYGQAHPGKLFYGSSSVGNSTHIGAEMLSHMTGMAATHVPYKGNMQALTDLVGGRINFMLDSRPSALPLIKAGELRALAVTSPQRAVDFPDLPAIAERVPGYQIEGWTGFFVRRGTEPAVIQRLAAALEKGVQEQRVVEGLRSVGSVQAFLGPREAASYMAQDHERMAKTVKETGIVAN